MADTNLKVQIKFQATGDKELARAFKTAAIANEKLGKAVEKNEKLQDKLNKTNLLGVKNNRLLSNTFATIRSKLLLMSFALTLVTGSVGKFIRKSAEFEKVKTRLNAMFGSVERGTQAFNTFNNIAATTPFTLQDVVEAGATLKAFGADAESLIKPVSDLAAFMGTTATEAAAALGRAFAGGAGAADILRERGILQLVRDSQGITDLTKITLPEFRTALEKTITDPSVGVAGATDKLSKTLSGLFSNLADSFTRLMAALGDVAAGSNFRKGVSTLTTLFSNMAEALKEINKSDIEKIAELREKLGIEAPTPDAAKEQAAIQVRIENLKKQIKPGRDVITVNNELSEAYQTLLDAIFRNQAAREGEDLFEREKAKKAEVRATATVKRLEKELGLIQQLIQARTDLSGAVLAGVTGSEFADLFLGDEPELELPQLKLRMPTDFGNQAQIFTDKLAEQLEEINRDKLDRAFESLLQFEDLFQDQLVNGFRSAFDQVISLQKENLDRRIDNELKALKKTDKFRKASMEERQTMEDDIRAKFAGEQKRLFRFQQLSQIAQVTMETAKNISALMTAALGASILDPSAPLRAKKIAIAMGAISAAQIATIAGQQPPAFARGGSFVTSGEQFIRVGDNPGGRERVDITPLSSPDFGDAGGSGSINVNIMGNVIGTQEFVRDNLLPEIENTIKRNLA